MWVCVWLLSMLHYAVYFQGLASIYLKPSTPLSDEEEEEEEAREEEGNINPFDSGKLH